MMKSLKNDTKKMNLNGQSKKIGIDKVIKRNEIINNSLNLKYKTVSSYYLKCRKNTESINPRVLKLKMIKQW